MNISFSKYHGAGNDFILINNQNGELNAITPQQIALLCHRRFGIGADGLMLLSSHAQYDFNMEFFNSDGAPGTMCGNGGRCIVAFAHALHKINHETTFLAPDGLHKAWVETASNDNYIVKLEMSQVHHIEETPHGLFLDTGSPHLICFTSNSDTEPVIQRGAALRNHSFFAPGGTNVNFVEETNQGLKVRTFERGVEDETWACGTGVTASALATAWKNNLTGNHAFNITTRGGKLKVHFNQQIKGIFDNIILEGPAQHVFSGTITL